MQVNKVPGYLLAVFVKPKGCSYCRLVYFSAIAHTVLITNVCIVLAQST